MRAGSFWAGSGWLGLCALLNRGRVAAIECQVTDWGHLSWAAVH